jgi:hypothetical protein
MCDRTSHSVCRLSPDVGERRTRLRRWRPNPHSAARRAAVQCKRASATLPQRDRSASTVVPSIAETSFLCDVGNLALLSHFRQGAHPKNGISLPGSEGPKQASAFRTIRSSVVIRSGYRDCRRRHSCKYFEMPTIRSPSRDDNAPVKCRDHKVGRRLAVNAHRHLISRDCAIYKSAYALASGFLEGPERRLQGRFAVDFSKKIEDDAPDDTMMQDAPERKQEGEQVRFERACVRKFEKG